MTQYNKLLSALDDLDDELADSFEPSKPRIYLTAIPCLFPGDVAGYALAEDGTAIITNLFTRESRAKVDLGLEGDASHDKYQEHYPDGYELEWVDDPGEHEGWREAIRRGNWREGA